MEKHHELQDLDRHTVLRNRREKDSLSGVKGQEFDRDRYELARVGKEQVLKVRSQILSSMRKAHRHSAALVWFL
jgi:choline transport protein